MRLWLSVLPWMLIAPLIAPVARGGEDVDSDVKYLEDMRKGQAEVNEARKKAYAELKQFQEKLAAQRAQAMKLGAGEITIDGETIKVEEPSSSEAALNLKQPVRDPYESNNEDTPMFVHDRWSINMSDFHIDRPQYISADAASGSAKNYFVIPFRVTNSTPKPRRVTTLFQAVTNKGVYNPASGGFLAERIVADSIGRPLAPASNPKDKALLEQGIGPLESHIHMATEASKLNPAATFEPGQTRWGAAVWSNFSNEFTELKVIISGLTNSYRYDERMRRVLVLTFTRNDDEFNVHRVPLVFKEKKWEYLWMWDQSINVPIPVDAKEPQIKSQVVKTPAGADKLMVAFPFILSNPTRLAQEISINSVSFVCPVEVSVGTARAGAAEVLEFGGQKINIEAKIVDDGRSNIYKAQYLKGLGQKESPRDRFALNKGTPDAGKGTKNDTEGSKTQRERRKGSIESGGKLDELWAVFDESDVDWDDVRAQVEAALTQNLDKKALAKARWEQLVNEVAPAAKRPALLGKNPGFLYDPRRRLTDDEFKQVREQVQKALPAAIDAAKVRKTVVAYFDCTSGLSSGSYRISRSYRQPGVVNEEWLKAWEELDKPRAPAAP